MIYLTVPVNFSISWEHRTTSYPVDLPEGIIWLYF
jgi:hypothetical protein